MNLVLGILLPTGERSTMDGRMDPQEMSHTGAWPSNASTDRTYFTSFDGKFDSTVFGWKGTGEP